MSRADRMYDRTRWREMRRKARRAILKSGAKMRPGFSITKTLRAAWRHWASKFAGREMWGGERNANRRPSARPCFRPSSGQRAAHAAKYGE